jgi:hypothetical protein
LDLNNIVLHGSTLNAFLSKGKLRSCGLEEANRGGNHCGILALGMTDRRLRAITGTHDLAAHSENLLFFIPTAVFIEFHA